MEDIFPIIREDGNVWAVMANSAYNHLVSIKERKCKMKKIITRFAFSLIAGLISGLLGLFIGTWFGGNYATWVVFFNLRGYEATGMIGLILFSLAGFVITWRIFGKDR